MLYIIEQYAVTNIGRLGEKDAHKLLLNGSHHKRLYVESLLVRIRGLQNDMIVMDKIMNSQRIEIDELKTYDLMRKEYEKRSKIMSNHYLLIRLQQSIQHGMDVRLRRLVELREKHMHEERAKKLAEDERRNRQQADIDLLETERALSKTAMVKVMCCS